MPRVIADERSDDEFTVTIHEGDHTTTHSVHVPAGFPAAIGCTGVAVAELVRLSFAFLLEREPARSILRDFSLEQIGGYFPEYPEEIRRAVAAGTGGAPSR
jgi:hypothetical protein